MSTDRDRTYDEYSVLLKQMHADVGIIKGAVTAAVLASVVPPLTPVFERACKDGFGIGALMVGPGVMTGMPTLYESPREVGADRIVNGVAGYELFRNATGGPHGVIVVDFG